MNHLTPGRCKLLIALIFTLFSINSFSQTLYRSRANGNWNANATWERSTNNGGSWANAGTGQFPTSANSAGVEIRSGHEITVNVASSASTLTMSNGQITFGNNQSLTVTGNLTINSSSVITVAAAFSSLTGTLTIGGNLAINNSGEISSEAGAGLASLTVNLSGNLSMAGSATIRSAAIWAVVSLNVNFTGTGTQTITKAPGTTITQSGGSATIFTVNNNATVNLGTSVLDGAADFSLASGGTLITAHTGGINSTGATGAIQLTGSRTFSSGANYTFNGSAAQNSGVFTTTPTANQVNNLTINNTAGNTTTGVTLQQQLAVANTLTLTSGHLTTTSNLLIMNAGSNVAGANYGANPKLTSGGSANSFVNGPMRKIGNTAFLFPVGKISTGTATNYGHHPCGISAPGNVNDAFTAEYIRGSAAALGLVSASGLDHVSNCEYWNIDRTTGTSTVNVSLSWNPSTSCNTAVYVNSLATLRGVHFNGSTWNAAGGSNDPGSAVTQGSVTWAGVSAFSPFSLGSTSSASNPLPVKLVNVKAYKSGSGNKVEWTNLTEEEVVKYEVEKSVNGGDYISMTALAARSNSNDRQDYNVYDAQPASLTFYRIKVTSIDGKILYSPVVKVATGAALVTEISLYPNPVSGRQMTLHFTNNKAGNYIIRIYAANGQVVRTEAFKHPGGSYSKTIELPGQLQAGQYFLQATGSEGQSTTIQFITQ